MLHLYNRDNNRYKKTFRLLLPRIDPRTSNLTALGITHFSNLSFFLLLLICLYLSSFMFSNFRIVPRQLYSLFIIIVHALSVFSNAFSCFSVSFKLIGRYTFYTFIEHVCSPKHTVFSIFISLCFVKRVSAFNCKLNNNETDRNA